MTFKRIIVIFVMFIGIFGFKSVDKPYQWNFPYDHGLHPDYQVEWWYITGHLKSEGDDEYNYGFEYTFFRIGNSFDQSQNAWSFKNIFITHFTVTDDIESSFNEYEFSHRESKGIAFSDIGNLNIKNGPFKLRHHHDRFIIDAKKGGII